MENKSHALAAGAFVVLVASLLVALAAWLSRDSGHHRIFEIASREGVTGLQEQAPVRYKGVTVGRVQSIALDSVARGQVLVRLALDGSAPITATTYATLGFQGVTGLAFVQLDDDGKDGAELDTSDDQPSRIPLRANLLSRLSDQGAGLLGQVTEGAEKANQLLDPRNQKALMEAVQNIGKAASSIDSLARQWERANLPAMGQQAGATLVAIQSTMARVDKNADAVGASADAFALATNRMTAPGGTLDQLGRAADTLNASGQSLNTGLLPRLNRATDDAAHALRRTGQVAERLQSNPQSLILGDGVTAPGPGEPGFTPPSK
ncbi:MAG: MlaD family protein [Rhodoferax sp.]